MKKGDHEHESIKDSKTRLELFLTKGANPEGSRPGACGEATGRWRRLPRLARASGRDPATPSTIRLGCCSLSGDGDGLGALADFSLLFLRRAFSYFCVVLFWGRLEDAWAIFWMGQKRFLLGGPWTDDLVLISVG